jgi:hypothetical protein
MLICHLFPGIALNVEQWDALKKNIDDIDAALEDL